MTIRNWGCERRTAKNQRRLFAVRFSLFANADSPAPLGMTILNVRFDDNPKLVLRTTNSEKPTAACLPSTSDQRPATALPHLARILIHHRRRRRAVIRLAELWHIGNRSIHPVLRRRVGIDGDQHARDSIGAVL